MDALSPTSAALPQHFSAAYQAGHVWKQTVVKQQILPLPEEWGLMKDKDGNLSDADASPRKAAVEGANA